MNEFALAFQDTSIFKNELDTMVIDCDSSGHT